MRKDPFVNEKYYHIYNRGVDKRSIFFNSKDYERFLFLLSDANRPERRNHTQQRMNSLRPILTTKPLVEIDTRCLMPNHYHLILKQITEGGISKYLQKIGIGYTKYFNTKYERSGVLFQGKTKSKLIESDEQLWYLRQYIHLNPLDLIESKWKERGIKNVKQAMEFLKNYKWTSCDYCEIYQEVLEEYYSLYRILTNAPII